MKHWTKLKIESKQIARENIWEQLQCMLIELCFRDSWERLEGDLRDPWEAFMRHNKKTINTGFRKLCDVSQILKVVLSPSCTFCNKKYSLARLLNKKLSFTTVCKNSLAHNSQAKENDSFEQITSSLAKLSCKSLSSKSPSHSLAKHVHVNGCNYCKLNITAQC